MPKPFSMSIRTHLIVIIILMTVGPLGIIVNSTLDQLDQAVEEAFIKTSEVVKSVENQQQILLSGAEQLAVTLSKIPAIQQRDRKTANLILSRLIASNPQYANIAVIDTSGHVWASAVPPKRPVSVADKRYFRNVLATGKPASGEYNVSNVLRKPVLNFGFPLHRGTSDRLSGVIVVAFYLENYGSLVERTADKSASILLTDHLGTILYSTNLPEIIGKTDREDLFRLMRDGSDTGRFEAVGNTGIPRFFSYSRLLFKDEQIPYMYVRAGLSKESLLAKPHHDLLVDVAALTAVMIILLALAAYISKRGIFDKIINLHDATKRFAQGDLDFRVGQRVSGGELGELGTALDDMAHRLAETMAERRRAAEELAAVIETTPDGFLVCERSGRILEANDSFCSLVGYSRNELLSMSIMDLEVAEGPAGERLEKIISDGRARFEIRHRRKDGETVGIEVSATCLPERGGRVYGFIRDTTERDLIQRELLRVQKMESISVLAAGIAHNFNNILTGVIGYISYARNHLEEPGKARNALESAERAGFSAAALARQLLTFSRGGEPVRSPVSVENLLRESVSLFLNGTNIRTVIDCPSGFTVNVDRGQIDQAFNNVVLNAVQSMPGGGFLRVSVESVTIGDGRYALAPGEYLRIVFADTGCGIAEENLIKIFDLYFTTRDTGTGLGLSTTQSIVGRHGGAIDISSRVGEGTTVTILLPASSEPASVGKAKLRRPLPLGNAAGRSVLVMDDQEIIRMMTARMLASLGYEVMTCDDGERAVELYRAARDKGTPFSAVLMDLTIPGAMGGKEAACRILEIDSGASLVVSSGYSEDPVMAMYRDYGFSAALLKPYNLEALMEVLDRIEIRAGA